MDGEKAKLLRSKVRWTQADLARFLGVSTNSVASWESGRTPIHATVQKHILATLATLDFFSRQWGDVLVRFHVGRNGFPIGEELVSPGEILMQFGLEGLLSAMEDAYIRSQGEKKVGYRRN